MKNRVEAQYLRPGEIVAIREAHGLIYLPVGPLEWHGPHLPLGVVAVAAEAQGVAEVLEDTHVGAALGADDL
ncbi:MAG: hypothetical protein V2A58_05630 [Planctomycetota bacterium]